MSLLILPRSLEFFSLLSFVTSCERQRVSGSSARADTGACDPDLFVNFSSREGPGNIDGDKTARLALTIFLPSRYFQSRSLMSLQVVLAPKARASRMNPTTPLGMKKTPSQPYCQAFVCRYDLVKNCLCRLSQRVCCRERQIATNAVCFDDQSA